MARRLRGDKDRNFLDAFADAFGEGREEYSRAMREGRTAQQKSENAPRWDELAGTYRTGIRATETANEMAGKLADLAGIDLAANPTAQAVAKKLPVKVRPANVNAREAIGIGREAEGKGRRIGQNLGTLAADVVGDDTRGIYWLLNAAQATGNVIAESAFGRVAPDLFGATPQKWMMPDGKTPSKRNIDIRTEEGAEEAFNRGLITSKLEMPGDRPTYAKGVRGGDNGEILKRNYEPGHLLALGVPTGIAINTGLGLMTPFGGAEGYYAVSPSDEDPTKTDNVISEVGQKYFMGKTGNLLPYNEFVKVRPDVSPEEYGQYQAFKYDKNFDGNIFDDGEVNLFTAIKTTPDGIHGPELQFLGRSLPVTTGIIPYASALAGGMAGLRIGGEQRRIRGGLIGGFAGLAAGQVAGNIIEAERRRRNAIENQNQLGY